MGNGNPTWLLKVTPTVGPELAKETLALEGWLSSNSLAQTPLPALAFGTLPRCRSLAMTTGPALMVKDLQAAPPPCPTTEAENKHL